jgi:dynein heavy chain
MYLKSIEDCTIKQADKQNEEMRPYYQYWERRIFNAITKMIIRALAANKTLWQRVEKPSLIRMNSFYNHPELLYHPTVEELRTKLEIFTRNILESTKQFGRWWDGFCKIFEERTHEETQDKYIPFTFYEDVMVNPVITQLHFEIVQARNQVVEKFTLFNRGWEKKQNLQQLFEKGEMAKLQKQIDKHQTTGMIEKHIVSFQKYILDMQRMSDYTRNYFVLIDYTEVKQKTIEKLHEWLDILGQSLREIALVAYRGIISDIAENEKALNEEVTGIENLKTLLKTITEVKNQSMEMEFRIVEVQE